VILLDTHILVWWVSDDSKLSQKAKKLIESASKKQEIIISSISIWEICLLVKESRLKLATDLETWIQKLESIPFIRFIPIDNSIAMKSVFLNEDLHKDPADRIIIATALKLGVKLITSDRKILNYKKVQTVW
jgi:PIN domain nuclease of toxin-antitoxin system